ncbi:type III secretion system inner membrane ring lipoprotein SctJ [Rhizobium alvei]|uniref:Lipoprotein n=1 Tax=Rhizobium alvei TaxID=1132659 RepID=A0ABT8YS43_9HYPH|nr:type III secretion inner membrane ring lipoprotein SctJ [Rhizobium alvei]MDO6966476.1 type III secretion inner membrane ring lipoprotein SctJ [Rhizobium alvei]
MEAFRTAYYAFAGSIRLLVRLVIVSSLLLLAGCSTELYSKLSETDANEMLSVLLANNINAEKQPGAEGTFNLVVSDEEVLRALDVLRNAGLPRATRENMGQVFAKSGIVSSPFEERVRYIYALGEDVAATIQQIDGVLTARVHIVMPEKAELGQEIKPSSAAVFIKQRPNVDLDFLVPQIRRLVSNSIEGVTFDNVTVVLVEAMDTPPAAAGRDEPKLEQILPGVTIAAASASGVWIWISVVGLVLVGLIAGIAVLAWLLLRKRGPAGATGREAEAAR